MSKRYLDYHGVSVLWSALKNYIASVTPSIKKLTFTGGVTAEYDGTEDVTVNIPTAGSSTITTVQSDWNVTDTTSDAYIANKPTIPAAVSVTNTLSSGTRVATINGTDVYAPAGGGSVTVDSALSSSSVNPVQNKIINSAIDDVWSEMDTLRSFYELNKFVITKNNNVYTPNINYAELIEHCYLRGSYALYDSKIYTPYSFGNINLLFPSSVTFCHIDFDGTNLIVEKFILTEDANQTRGCTVTYSSHTLSVSFNSSTSVLDISTE